MDLRAATTEDVAEIRTVANESMLASYGHAIDEETIREAVERWYDVETLGDSLEDEDVVFVVAVEDGTVVGFVQGYVSEGRERVGGIDWLHVLPDHRGKGIGSQLLKRAEQRLTAADVDRIEGRVLADNEAGTEFYAEQGFELVGDRELDIGGRSFEERVYAKLFDAGERTSIETRTTEDGTTVYVAYDDTARGSKAPFYGVYADKDRSERYGWMCGNDESFDVAMDTMERIECNTCQNKRKAARWDAAYL